MNRKRVSLNDLGSKNIGIFGFGKEGKATYSFLRKHDVPAKQITIIDANSDLAQPDPEVAMLLGKVTSNDLEPFDLIFKSPGVSPQLACFQGIGHKITTQTQFFFDNYDGKVIAITGTKGKSTTTSLIYEALKLAGQDVKLVGNIGLPVLEQVERGHTYDQVVFELSSYQLEGLEGEIEIGVLINLHPEHHTTRHGGLENYYQAKLRVLKHSKHRLIGAQIKNDHPAIFQRYQSEQTQLFGKEGKYRFENNTFFVDTIPVFDDTGMQLKGMHNRYNACAAVAVCDLLNVEMKHLQHALQNYSGLPHRLEYLGVHHDITRIDDAISTTPQSTIAALDTFKQEVDTIFLGGKDGGYDFSKLIEKLQEYQVRNLILFPDSGKLIKEQLPSDQFTIYETDNMDDAVTFAKEHTKPGTIAVLSCASPSYSIWKNFEEKGEQFKSAIENLSA